MQDRHRQASWEEIRKALEGHWIAHHGQPGVIRGDADGAWRSNEAERYCSIRGILLEFAHAEAQWQIGIVEASIKSVKAVLSALCEEFNDMIVEEFFLAELCGRVIRGDNHCGYSPLQHALGQAPDELGHMLSGNGGRRIPIQHLGNVHSRASFSEGPSTATNCQG